LLRKLEGPGHSTKKKFGGENYRVIAEEPSRRKGTEARQRENKDPITREKSTKSPEHELNSCVGGEKHLKSPSLTNKRVHGGREGGRM